MKIKVSEAQGLALNGLVAKCEGFGPDNYMRNIDIRSGANGKVVGVMVPILRQYVWWTPSTDWVQGGPILERERICISIQHDGVWLAYSMQNYADRQEFMHSGPTPLVAAMRCYVTSKLGEEVEVPDELLKG